MVQPIFALADVHYAYEKTIPALRGLSLDIHRGERTAVIGANGSGKSTMLALLDALIFPDSGSMHFDGRPITPAVMRDATFQREFRLRVGYVFQNPDVQLFCPTVREDILFGPLQLGVPAAEIDRRFERVVDLFKLGPLLDRSCHHLSIGEKKKAAIASVLVIEPEVLLLDEPTAGLDPQTTRDIIAVLQEAHKNGKTVIMATHDLHIVEEIADTIHVFGTGRAIIRSGTSEEILEDREFLQNNNLVHILVHRHRHGGHIHEHVHEHKHEHGPDINNTDISN
jgi:cobalt/nickel transport system ATP-binding protein